MNFYFVNSAFCQLLFCQLCFGQLLFCQLCFGQLLFCQLCFGQLLFCQIYFDQLCVLSTIILSNHEEREWGISMHKHESECYSPMAISIGTKATLELFSWGSFQASLVSDGWPLRYSKTVRIITWQREGAKSTFLAKKSTFFFSKKK